jgi:hypothetical protein
MCNSAYMNIKEKMTAKRYELESVVRQIIERNMIKIH